MWWWLTPGSEKAFPTQLSAAQSADTSERILLVARDVQTAFLVQPPGAASTAATTPDQAPQVVVPGSSPEQAAAALAGPARLSGRAVTAVAAWARTTDHLRAGTTTPAGTAAQSSTVSIEALSARRELDGVLHVCARVRSDVLWRTGGSGGEVVPWVVTEDPSTGQITDLQVQDWDDGPYDC
ncbi:hypothetical protein ACUN7V_16525 [Quadrisphaera oryzae]|uniref:hypothetical protein n=1 Tax=Quadrisphaera TaxID=317661 RepID=UPI001645C014|nr:hypothetical protein [Quadrisphaera sp. RL12-1S]MBC3760881.1 hypothetical protein [Quadrisphaera sp. RL12-1S]